MKQKENISLQHYLIIKKTSTMKKILLLLLVVTATLSSCKKECAEWYEGEDCKTEMREKFLGGFDGIRYFSGGSVISMVGRMEKGNNLNNLNFDLGHFTPSIRMELKTSAKVKIERQYITNRETGEKYFIEGNGNISGEQIHLNLTAYVEASDSHYSYILIMSKI